MEWFASNNKELSGVLLKNNMVVSMINGIERSIRVITLDHVIIVYIFSTAVSMFLFIIIFSFNFLLWRHMLLIKQSTMQLSPEPDYLPGLHTQG